MSELDRRNRGPGPLPWDTDMAAMRTLSGRAWDDFCEQVRRAGHMVERFGPAADALDRTEWYRFLTRLLRNGLERFVENCEPEHPRLRDVSWRQSINFQCPDQDHLLAEFVDGRHDYRISGNRGSVPYFVISAWTARQPADPGARNWASRGVEALAEFDPATLRTTAMLRSESIAFDAEGNFTVIASREDPGNGSAWLPLTEDCVGIIVRVVYHRREETIPPAMRIERLDVPARRPLRPEELSAALAKSAQLVLGYAELVRGWWQEKLAAPSNHLRFSRALYLSNGGVPDRQHGFGTWECGHDEVLVLHFHPIACEYWIFQLCNMWQENLDTYEDGAGYVQKYRAHYEDDGSVYLITAERDPGIGGNHLPTFGHRHGGWSLRFIGTATEPGPISVYRLRADELKGQGLAALAGMQPIVTGEFLD